MTISNTDIVNRALQLIGTRTTVTDAELAGNITNEAIQANLCLGALRDWCFGIVNWNFARKTVTLTRVKAVTTPSPWAAATSPSPPWLYEYSLPSDYIKAQYLTNSDTVADATSYLGEPQRSAIATDTISATQQQVLLTNQPLPVLVYTSRVTDPNLWPWYFERIVVAAIALSMSFALAGDKELLKYLESLWQRFIQIGEEANRTEGLIVADTTPEWIQALGIEYPNRRAKVIPQRTNNDNRG